MMRPNRGFILLLLNGTACLVLLRRTPFLSFLPLSRCCLAHPLTLVSFLSVQTVRADSSCKRWCNWAGSRSLFEPRPTDHTLLLSNNTGTLQHQIPERG
ncbi:hypothetical protein FQA47_001136 [Oryzias melastigma]|uniref:Uncharacterized protein n=1 Tax=Oryzias melastigma TaxID=30732 RepID=A0A834C0V1_ORYME|nr:hypothetical protein FQA47_001136 [Oryzias melastigma]